MTNRPEFDLTTYLDWLNKSFARVDDLAIEDLVSHIMGAGRVFICGNGGSAATASHMACDLTKTTKKGLCAIALTDNVPLITAIANDDHYQAIFTDQLRPHRPGPEDLLICISASGNSSNILHVLKYASAYDVQTFGLFGFGGGEAAKLTRASIIIDSMEYGIVEDAHSIIMHIVTDRIMRA